MNRILEYIIVCVIGLIFSISVTFKLIVSLCSNGIRAIRGANYRSRPKIMTEEKLGKSSYLHLKNITLHIVEKGNSRKPLMLFLHGFPEFWFSWRHQLDSELGKNFRLVAVDMRGYGDSDKPKGVENYKMEILIEDVRQAIQALGHDTCNLVGHDWGGAVAWAFAAAHPEIVAKLAVLNCPHPGAFAASLRSSWSQFLKSWYMFFFQLPCYPEWYFTRQDLLGLELALKGAVSHDELEAFKYTYSLPGALTGPINYYRAAFRYPYRGGGGGGSGRKMETHTLLIFGGQDKYIGEKAARLSGKYCSNLDFQLIPQASHWVQQDAPDQVNRLLARFFARRPNSGDEADYAHAVRRGLEEVREVKDTVKDDVGKLLHDLSDR